MKRFISMKLCSRFLSVILLLNILLQNAYAQSTYTVETGGRSVLMSLAPYSDGNEIMVPFRALTEGLGGIWLDVPTGKAHKVAILNDLALYIITNLDIQIIMPLSNDDLHDAFDGVETVEGYMPIIMEMILDGTISVKQHLDYPIVEKDGDLYFPLRVFASSLELDYSINGNTITFDPEFKDYQPSNTNVTFQLDVSKSKTYDGKPITWSQDALKVFCDGRQVTDYLPLTLEYSYLNQNNEMQFISSPPQNAGSYALAVQTNSKDPKYSGTGYFSFMIYPAELVLTAKDAEISAGASLPPFSYDISGIISGESKADAIVEEPVLTAQGAVDAGSYPIEITGGTAGVNYIIKDRHAGTLTISPNTQTVPTETPTCTFWIQCIDRETGYILKTDLQQAAEGSSVTITAPNLTGYRMSGSKTQKILVSSGAVVKFYYTRITEGLEGIDNTPPTTSTIIYQPYVTGYGNGMFYPQNPIKRNECAVMLYRLMQQTKSSGISQGRAREFTDVPAEAWYHSAVNALAAKGIADGYSDGSFRPEKEVTRAEFVVLALRFAEIPLETSGKRFSDVPTSHWASDYIRTAVKNSVVSGYSDGSFHPDMQITRAEAVTILNRISGRSLCAVKNTANSFIDVPAAFWAYENVMLAANQSVSN